MKTKSRTYSQLTIKKLYSPSGNRCYMYGCNQILLDAEHDIDYSQIAHIHTLNQQENPNTAAAMRYDPTLSESVLNSYENLILLCPNHHKLIDEDTSGKYTVEYLTEMKASHEREVAEKLRTSTIAPLSDYKNLILPGLIDAVYDIAYSQIVEIDEKEIERVITETMNLSSLTRFALFNIIVRAPIDNMFNMSTVLDSDYLSMEEGIRSSRKLEDAEYFQEVRFTGNPDFTDPITGAIIDYSDNQVLKYNVNSAKKLH